MKNVKRTMLLTGGILFYLLIVYVMSDVEQNNMAIHNDPVYLLGLMILSIIWLVYAFFVKKSTNALVETLSLFTIILFLFNLIMAIAQFSRDGISWNIAEQLLFSAVAAISAISAYMQMKAIIDLKEKKRRQRLAVARAQTEELLSGR